MTKQTKRGFTLIELLVVVLIIGILAAVAVPQYKVAVEKSRLTEALTVIKSIKEAQERYYLTHGDYTGKIEDLDISFPFAKQSNADDIDKTTINLPSGITVLISSSSAYVYAMNNTKTNQLVLYYFKPDSISQWQCGAKQTDTTANRVCKSLGGKYRKNDKCAIGDCTIYSL